METEARPHMSIRDYVHVVFKRKIQILLFFGATLCAVAIGSFLTTPKYEATAQLLIKIGRENMYVPTLPASGNSSPIISFNREEQINSEIEILKGRFLVERVVESLGSVVIYPDLSSTGRGLLSGLFQNMDVRQSRLQRAVLRLQKGMKVAGVRKSDVIELRFKHKDPRTAATVVNTLVNFYLERHLEIHKSPQAFRFFQEQAQILKDKLKGAQDKLEGFKKKHQLTSSLEEERSLLLRQEADLRTALNQTLSEEAETENRLRNPVHDDNLLSRLVDLELKEQELLTKYTDESHFVQSVREEMQIVRQTLAEQRSRRYEAEMKALKAKEETQRAQLAEYQKRLEELKRIEMEFNRLQQTVEVDRENYRLYLTKFEESRVSDAMDTEKIANVSLIEPARPPSKPVSPKIFLNMVLAIFLGGFGGFGLAFFSEYLNDSLEKDEDVENHLHLPVLASIPELKM